MAKSLPRVVVLFADVVNSTRMFEILGDEEALALINRLHDALIDASKEFSASLVKKIGDALLLSFPSPVAAFLAASAMLDVLRDFEAPVATSIRIGFHLGEVVEVGGDMFGDTVNVAAHVAKLAKPGAVAMTGPVAEALPPFLRKHLRRISSATLKGRQDPMPLLELVPEGQDEGLVTLVGAGATYRDINPSLSLQYRGRDYTVNSQVPEIMLGRHSGSGLVLKNIDASRRHAKAFLRQGKILLADMSSNGTFVRMDNGHEVRLRREELILRGAGSIICGMATELNQESDLIRFEVMGN